MHVAQEMAVHALHPVLEMDVFQVDGLLPLVRVVRSNLVVVEVEHVAVPVLLEDGLEHPAVAVVIGELRVLELGVQLGDFFQEIKVFP